jgi:predicted hydrolase (HD superfamily)
MPHVPTLPEAQAILEKYNKDEFHLRLGQVVSHTMAYFAKEHDPDNVEFWAVVGLLHDVDFEMYPEEHCVKGEELLRENDVDDRIIAAAMSHGWGMSGALYEPKHIMEKILFATDELTGLIGAVSIMRPSKSYIDLEVSSVKKKYKDKKFAAGCSREVINLGAENLGWTLEDLIGRTILALREMEESEK